MSNNNQNQLSGVGFTHAIMDEPIADAWVQRAREATEAVGRETMGIWNVTQDRTEPLYGIQAASTPVSASGTLTVANISDAWRRALDNGLSVTPDLASLQEEYNGLSRQLARDVERATMDAIVYGQGNVSIRHDQPRLTFTSEPTSPYTISVSHAPTRPLNYASLPLPNDEWRYAMNQSDLIRTMPEGHVLHTEWLRTFDQELITSIYPDGISGYFQIKVNPTRFNELCLSLFGGPAEPTLTSITLYLESGEVRVFSDPWINIDNIYFERVDNQVSATYAGPLATIYLPDTNRPTAGIEYSSVIDITSDEWAPGIWAGMENARVEIRYPNVMNEIRCIVTQIDYDNRTVALDQAVPLINGMQIFNMQPDVPSVVMPSRPLVTTHLAYPDYPAGTRFKANIRGLTDGDNLALQDVRGHLAFWEPTPNDVAQHILSIEHINSFATFIEHLQDNAILAKVTFAVEPNITYTFNLEQDVYFDEHYKPLNHWGRTAR
jgi:hypothetical protein